MKTLSLSFLLLLFVSLIFFNNNIHAQCAAGVTPVVLHNDTSGKGTGNDLYTFSVPKFDPTLGTLTAVTVTSDVVVNYIYSIGNTRTSSALFKTRILRTDDITSIALDPSFISEATQTPLLNTIVPANTIVQVGPAVMNYNLQNIISDGRVVNFMGVGTVDFTYINSSFVAFSGPSGSNVDFTQLNDSIHFRVAYSYCPASILASNMFSFNAYRKNDNIIQVSWQQPNEEKERMYTIQMSTDAKHFNNVASIPANSTGLYTYPYNYNTGFNKKYFFRVMQNDRNKISYSAIAVVDGSDKKITGMKVFPTTPIDKIAVVFPKNEDRKISIYSTTGQLIWSNTYLNSNTARISLPGNLKKGIYLVEAINLHSQERAVSKIVMQ